MKCHAILPTGIQEFIFFWGGRGFECNFFHSRFISAQLQHFHSKPTKKAVFVSKLSGVPQNGMGVGRDDGRSNMFVYPIYFNSVPF